MDEKELLKQAFEYENVPSIITYCFTEPCPMKDKCIHYLTYTDIDRHIYG